MLRWEIGGAEFSSIPERQEGADTQVSIQCAYGTGSPQQTQRAKSFFSFARNVRLRGFRIIRNQIKGSENHSVALLNRHMNNYGYVLPA
jgi:hypothetical protein